MKAKILAFKGVHAYCNFWDKIVPTVTGRYLDILTDLKRMYDNDLPQGDTTSNLRTYGSPVPTSYRDAMERRFFLNMELYNNTYEELKPFLLQLEKLSEGIIPKEVIKPTDLEIGIFSFDRAAMALDAVPALYSVKEDRFYPVDEKAVPILGKNGEHLSECSYIKKLSDETLCRLRYKVMPKGVECLMTQKLQDIKVLYCVEEQKIYEFNDESIAIKDASGTHLQECSVIKEFSDEKLCRYRYKAMPSGKDCVIVEVPDEGVKEYTSSNKKSFLRKEKAPRPNRMIRFFVLTGGNWGAQTYWAGLTAIIAAIFLESKGYAVRITGVIGVEDSGINIDNNIDLGARFHMIDLKAYDETMDSLSLLYILADMSFFRVRIFEYFVAQQFKYGDTPNSGLGWMPSFSTFKAAFSEEVKKRNIAEEKDVLYYYFGGNQCTSLEDAKRELIRIICDAENTNKEMLIKLGYEFPPPESNSGKKVGDIDCP